MRIQVLMILVCCNVLSANNSSLGKNEAQSTTSKPPKELSQNIDNQQLLSLLSNETAAEISAVSPIAINESPTIPVQSYAPAFVTFVKGYVYPKPAQSFPYPQPAPVISEVSGFSTGGLSTSGISEVSSLGTSGVATSSLSTSEISEASSFGRSGVATSSLSTSGISEVSSLGTSSLSSSGSSVASGLSTADKTNTGLSTSSSAVSSASASSKDSLDAPLASFSELLAQLIEMKLKVINQKFEFIKQFSGVRKRVRKSLRQR